MESFKSKNSLARVRKPVNLACGLPNSHYIDETVFNREKYSLLFDNWAGIGFEKDVPNKGDVYPVYFLGMPLLLVRDQDNNIRVFQNTCRHRGMILIEKPSNVRGTIRCPYHSWCYSLKGELRATPHVGGPGNNIHPNIKRTELGLYKINSFVWHGVIFINISGKAPSFNEIHERLLVRWKEFEQPLLHSGTDSSIELTINANWKLAVENYCESYHLPWVHPGLNSYSKIEDHYNIEEAGFFSGQGSNLYQQLKGKHGEVFQDFQNLSKKWEKGSEYISVFPNVLLGVHRDHLLAIVLIPTTTDVTVERIEIYYAGNLSIGKAFAEMREKNRAQWKAVFEEDIFVVEGMQKGRRGVLFDGGKFSPIMDASTHIFHKWVADNYVNSIETSSENDRI